VVPQTQFREEEAFEPQRILEKEGARVVVASTAARTCRGIRDGVLEAVVAIEEANGEDYDAVVLAGGSSVPTLFWKDKKLQKLVSGMAEAGKIVAAISLSTVVLAKASLLEGRKATVYFLPEALDELKNGGATYVEKRVIVDGNIVMAEGPKESGAFAKAVVAALAG
jgi:protease I